MTSLAQDHTDGRVVDFESILSLHGTQPCTDAPLPNRRLLPCLTHPRAQEGPGKDLGSAEIREPQEGLSQPEALIMQQWGKRCGDILLL